MEKYETVIVGAGPAGLKAAETLAKAGKEVLVLEQKSVFGDKVCAGGLTVKDIELGIPLKLVGRKFKKVIYRTPLQKTVIRQDNFFCTTVDRKKLGSWMAKRAEKAGAEVRVNSRVDKIGKDYVVVNNKKIGFKYLIGADGSNSIIRRHLKLGNKDILLGLQYKTKKKFRDMEFIFDYDRFGPSYAWIFPHKNFTAVGVGVTPHGNVRKTKKNFNEWCKKLFNPAKSEFQAHTIRCGYEGHKFGNKFLIGDAAGFASFFTGEGIYFALISGIDAANKIIDKKYKCLGIEHILNVKKIEDSFARHLEKHKTMAKIEMEILAVLAKSKWIDREIIEHIE